MRLSVSFLALLQGVSALTLGNGRRAIIRETPDLSKRKLLQDIVTWDEKSLFVHGERVMIFSGEVHPFRLPVPSLWADVFEKIKALGFNGVSFYVDWGLLEGKPGEFRADGVFALEPFFEAATQAGIWLIARPGPYINAEASGGGFPGWLQRVKGVLRTNATDYLTATDNYMANVNAIIAKAQITNGGPVILYQPENEYSGATGVPFPVPEYMAYVENQAREAGIVVPLINNDAYAGGHNAPGTGEGEVDIYGHDSYPLGFDCANPTVWPAGNLPTSFRKTHLQQSPKTPYAIPEFQGGSFDPYGGPGFAKCSELLNQEFARVFYKNNMAAQVASFSIYMIFGGTNWGYLGHPGGYSSYDYGAAIEEDGRQITREKYSELKLEAQFLKVSPGYLVSEPALTYSTGVYSTNTDIAVTPLLGSNGTGSFFVLRHTDYSSQASTKYTLKLPTSAGNKTIPQLGGSLTLNGRDSKIHLADYPVGDFSLQYSTAEVFTWKKFHDKTVVVLYGGAGELHEFAVKTNSAAKVIEGSGVTTKAEGGTLIAQWTASSERRVVQVDDLQIYLVDRNTAYNYWVPDLPSAKNGAYGTSYLNPESVIVVGGYLVRSVEVSGSTLTIRGDFNSSSGIEVIGAPKGVTKLSLNGSGLSYSSTNSLGNWVATVSYSSPKLEVPELEKLTWKVVDSLPEIQSGYDDSDWPAADHTTSNNTLFPLKMPVSLYASDYGFNGGVMVMRGHFTASGAESSLFLSTQGGTAFASTVFLDDQLLGSWKGNDANEANDSTYTLPTLTKGRNYTLTIVCDNTGLDENWVVGADLMKAPRGIINYALNTKSGSGTKITEWKITGNFGGEDYIDKDRGPLNEGGMWFERHGLHLPGAPMAGFKAGSPYDGFKGAGIKYYTADLKLDFPSSQYDIPASFVMDNSTSANTGAYRAFLYVNGWMFGRYVSNVGPQTRFPVPEGILNYRGTNTIGLAVWAVEDTGAKVPGFSLDVGTPVLTSRKDVEVVNAKGYEKRNGVY